MCVSQFTLLASTQKGNKPDFHRAMVSFVLFYLYAQLGHPFILPVFFKPPSSQSSQATEPSRQLYKSFLERMGDLYNPDKIKGAPLSPVCHRSALPLKPFRLHCRCQRHCIDGRFGAMMNVSLTNEVCDNSTRTVFGYQYDSLSWNICLTIAFGGYRALLRLPSIRANLNTSTSHLPSAQRGVLGKQKGQLNGRRTGDKRSLKANRRCPTIVKRASQMRLNIIKSSPLQRRVGGVESRRSTFILEPNIL